MTYFRIEALIGTKYTQKQRFLLVFLLGNTSELLRLMNEFYQARVSQPRQSTEMLAQTTKREDHGYSPFDCGLLSNL